MQRITPYLWFNNNAEGAVKFYTSIASAEPGRSVKPCDT